MYRPAFLQRSAVNQVVPEVLDIHPARQVPAVLFVGAFPDQGHDLPATLSLAEIWPDPGHKRRGCTHLRAVPGTIVLETAFRRLWPSP